MVILRGWQEIRYSIIFSKPGQKIGVKESSRNLTIIQEALDSLVVRKEYVFFDANTMEATFVRYPEREEFLEEIKENLIVEFYNR